MKAIWELEQFLRRHWNNEIYLVSTKDKIEIKYWNGKVTSSTLSGALENLLIELQMAKPKEADEPIPFKPATKINGPVCATCNGPITTLGYGQTNLNGVYCSYACLSRAHAAATPTPPTATTIPPQTPAAPAPQITTSLRMPPHSSAARTINKGGYLICPCGGALHFSGWGNSRFKCQACAGLIEVMPIYGDAIIHRDGKQYNFDGNTRKP